MRLGIMKREPKEEFQAIAMIGREVFLVQPLPNPL